MSIATAMYHSGKDTLHKVGRNVPDMPIPKGVKQRRLHKAFLRYHDPKNWPLLREALKEMGRADLIGNGKQHLIPSFQPKLGGEAGQTKSVVKAKPFATKHTGFNKAKVGDNRRPKPSSKGRGR
jgi:hypothetical protein